MLCPATASSGTACLQFSSGVIIMLTGAPKHSGAVGHSATNRASSTAAATDTSYPPAIRQHGHDSPNTTPGPRRIQSPPAADAEHTSKQLPVPQSDATTADECSDGCTDTTTITSP